MNALLRGEKWDFVFDNKKFELEKDHSYSRPYLDFYSFKKPPFAITPDPEFLYSSCTHKTAIENILYGIEACMGFILLIGEVGTGKTTLCRAILDNLEGRAETVYIINPSLSGMEIIEAILDDLGISYPVNSSKKTLIDHLNRFLLKATKDKPVVIIIDDAQTMTPDGLENLRLLSNLETDKKKLLQLVLVGQPELQGLLSRPELRQLRQRVAICCRLGLIGYAELKQYISLRLFVAGDRGRTGFSSGAIKMIYRASHGIPRLINIICDYALLAGYVDGSLLIRKKHAARGINELRNQSILDESLLSDMYQFLKGKRIWAELLILFVCLLILVFINNDMIFLKKDIPADLRLKAQPTHIPPIDTPKPVIKVIPDNDIKVKKTDTDRFSLIDEPASPDKNTGVYDGTPKNYIVQLLSLKTLKDAQRGGLALRKQGIDAHWNSVHMTEKGTWHRVYKDGFQTEKDAKAFMEEKGFHEGVVLSAPWTVIITPGNKDMAPEDIYRELNEKGYDCTLEKAGGTVSGLILGAYISFERAFRASQEIIDMGFDARPVKR